MSPVDGFRKKGVTVSGDEIYAVYRRFFREALTQGAHPCLIPGAREALEQLYGNLTLGIVSSHPQIYLEPEARAYGILPLVEMLRGDSQNKIESLGAVCQMLGLERNRTMYVGDTIYDIRSAREAGLVTAGVTTGYHTREALEAEKPDYLFTTLGDILTNVSL